MVSDSATPTAADITLRQSELARHALGLPNRHKKSYRNRFVTGPGHTDYDDWMAMVACGAARRRDGKRLPFGGDDMFWLTSAGARLVLQSGEKLCTEDFPP